MIKGDKVNKTYMEQQRNLWYRLKAWFLISGKTIEMKLWILHRVSAIVLAFLVLLHIIRHYLLYIYGIEISLGYFGTLVYFITLSIFGGFHVANGIRIILLDLGIGLENPKKMLILTFTLLAIFTIFLLLLIIPIIQHLYH
jgi:succinate dehydrogenase/fumarate reductase cytochrome b subunit